MKDNKKAKVVKVTKVAKVTKPAKQAPKIVTTTVAKVTKPVMLSIDLEILKILINDKPLIPLLRVLRKNKELHTRELLVTMGSWGYGQSLMKRATNLGLIARTIKKEKTRGRGKPRIYNALTNKGREVVGLADKIGYEK
ncbi:MAG: hypothetical protein DA328_02240 [Nitrososphaeraceae archaeon]|nr:hypothetical protein [Nitrososphaeraceae archaeon]